MPRRTNTFQEVVAIVYSHLPGRADLHEATFLRNRLTGEDREVDVVVRSRAAGHETVVAVEAVGRGRRVTVDWVEQMAGKHRNLPTDKVVLVSEGGFSKQAMTLARAEKMVPMTPQHIADSGSSGRIVSALESVETKKFVATMKKAWAWAERPGEDTKVLETSRDFDLVLSDGTSANALDVVLRYLVTAYQRPVMEQLDMAEEGEKRPFLAFVGPGWEIPYGRKKRPVYVMHGRGSGRRLYRVDRLIIAAEVKAYSCDIPLVHREFDELDLQIAYGTGVLGREPTLLVATKGSNGERLSVRFRGVLLGRYLSKPSTNTWGFGLVGVYPDLSPRVRRRRETPLARQYERGCLC